MNERTGIDLFAGIGGFSLAMQMNGVEVIEQVEIEPYPVRVLEKNFPEVKRHGDIRTYKPTANPWIVCGGFPCQDISAAGKGAGLSGKRSSLWWEMHRVIDECRPDWVLIENVPALRVRGADSVLLSLEELGYSCRAFVVGASDIEASHQRKRIWIVANGNDGRCARAQISEKQWTSISLAAGSRGVVGNTNSKPECSCSLEGGRAVVETVKSCKESTGSSNVDDAARTRLEGKGKGLLTFPAPPGHEQYKWEAPRVKSRLGRTIDGISGRVDKHRIKALGNAIVPHLAALIISAIIQTEDQVNSEK